MDVDSSSPSSIPSSNATAIGTATTPSNGDDTSAYTGTDRDTESNDIIYSHTLDWDEKQRLQYKSDVNYIESNDYQTPANANTYTSKRQKITHNIHSDTSLQ